MHKAERMTEAPMKCLVCFRGNLPDDPDSMDDFFVIDLERDVNWGDPTYLCKYCAERVAALVGFVPHEEVKDLENVKKALERKVHDLRAKLEERNRRLDQIGVGKTAVRRTKKERSTGKAKA